MKKDRFLLGFTEKEWNDLVELAKLFSKHGRPTDELAAEISRIQDEETPGQPVTKCGTAFLEALLTSAEKIEGQRELFKKERDDYPHMVEASLATGLEGIDLDVYSTRTLDAILHKFSENNYESDLAKMTEPELLEGAGVKKIRKSRGKDEYPGYETSKIHDSLTRLTREQYPIIIRKFLRYDGKEKQNRYDVALTYESLIKVIWVYRNVKENTLKEYSQALSEDGREARGHLKERFSHYRIKLNPLIKTDIMKSFRILPARIYSMIKDHKPKGGRVEAPAINYIKWLHRHSKGRTEIHINYKELAKQIKLGKFIKYYKLKELRRKITRYHQLGKSLGFVDRIEISRRSPYSNKSVDVLPLLCRCSHLI
ncbi:hypothetical protein ES707_15103 [subsurface metagenome]